MTSAVATNSIKDSVNFTSQPRELREWIYEVALINRKPVETLINFNRRENGTRDTNLHPS